MNASTASTTRTTTGKRRMRALAAAAAATALLITGCSIGENGSDIGSKLESTVSDMSSAGSATSAQAQRADGGETTDSSRGEPIEGCTVPEGSTTLAAAEKPTATNRYRHIMAPEPARLSGPWEVMRVIDGDTMTVAVDCHEIDVRIIGIDSPETRHPKKNPEAFGREATAALEAAAEGQMVWLEYDPTQDATDDYGRDLAHVWLADAGGAPDELLGYEQIAAGLAREYTFDADYRYAEDYRAAENAAQYKGVGIWGEKS